MKFQYLSVFIEVLNSFCNFVIHNFRKDPTWFVDFFIPFKLEIILHSLCDNQWQYNGWHCIAIQSLLVEAYF